MPVVSHETGPTDPSPRPAPQRGFQVTEFEARLERAQRGMREAGIDALFLTTEPEIRYFSGFMTQFWESPTRPWFLVIPGHGKPIAVVPEIGASLMASTWVDDVRSWPSPRPEDEGVTLLADALRDAVGDRAEATSKASPVVGLLRGPETTLRMPLRDLDKLQNELAEASFVDITHLISSLRMVKSDSEIDKIRHICQVASDAFDQLPNLVQADQSLSELFRRFRIALLAAGADDVPYLVGACERDGYHDVISPPGANTPQPGDILMLDTGAKFDGYYCDFDRNYSIGPATDTLRRAHETLYAATEAGFNVARPGATCDEIFNAMRNKIFDAGFAAGSIGRMGHGLGMQLTEWPSHRAGDQTVLRPGMVLTLEPELMTTEGRGMVHEENFVVREDGIEILSRRAPKVLPEIHLF